MGRGWGRIISHSRGKKISGLLALDLLLQAANFREQPIDLEFLLILEFLVELAKTRCAKVVGFTRVQRLGRRRNVRAGRPVAGV